MIEKNKFKYYVLLSPVFLLMLLILLINDHYLKYHYPNFITGKISDFTGLFIFPAFLCIIFSRFNKIASYTFTALAFIFWKTPISDPFIEFWCNNIFPISRTVDYSDLLALVVLPISFHYFFNKQRVPVQILFYKKIAVVFIAILSVITFTATSYIRNFDYNKKYEMTQPINVLVAKINSLNLTQSRLTYSVHKKNSNFFRIEQGDTLFFYTSGMRTYRDTLFKKDGKTIDTIFSFTHPVLDTQYLFHGARFELVFPAGKYFKDVSNSGYCQYLPAFLQINGDETRSEIILKTVRTSNCMGMFEKEAENKEKEILLKAFETEVILKLME